jgi:hypothetical protein
LIGRKRLFFRFALGADGSLECYSGLVLSIGVFYRSMLRSLWLRSCAAFEGEDDLADLDLLTFLNSNVFDHTAYG